MAELADEVDAITEAIIRSLKIGGKLDLLGRPPPPAPSTSSRRESSSASPLRQHQQQPDFSSANNTPPLSPMQQYVSIHQQPAGTEGIDVDHISAAEVAFMKEELRQLRDQHAALLKTQSRSSETIADLSAQLRFAKQQADDCAKQMNSLGRERDVLSAQLTGAHALNERLERAALESAVFANRAHEAAAQAEEFAAENQMLRANLRELEEALADRTQSSRSDAATLRKQLTAAEETVKALREQLAHAKRELGEKERRLSLVSKFVEKSLIPFVGEAKNAF